MLTVLDLLFPKFCLGCGRFNSYLCPKCVFKITQKELICPNCQKPSVGGVTHPLCRKKYGLDGLWSLGAYQPPLDQLIHKLKYEFVTDLVPTLTELLINYFARSSPYFLQEIKRDWGKNWTVLPVPLHSRRQNWRGFNQSALLGKMIACKIGLEFKELLVRVNNTKPQVGLEGGERKKNIRGAFSLPINYNLSPISYLLIDDVWTTGSTLIECAYVLKKAGAKKVWALTLAR